MNKLSLLNTEINPGKSNRVAINRGAPQPARQAYGIFKAVLFAPEDIELVVGQPDIRRRFMDDLIVQMRPALGDARRDFDRVYANASIIKIRAQLRNLDRGTRNHFSRVE